MSSIHSRNPSQALARYASQVVTAHQGRTPQVSSKYSQPSALRGGQGVKADKHGGLSGKVRPDAEGKVSLPGGLSLQAPPRGGMATHILAPNKLLVLTADARGLVSLKTKYLGVALDEKKGALKGSVLPQEVNGRKLVELPVLGQMPVPQQGLTDSYLLSPDKLLSLKHETDGTVTVNTKTLGLEADKKGFKGYLLPMDGKVDIAGKQLDVSGMKPGQTKTKTLKLKGKKFKVKLRMNEDGTVTVQGKRKKGFFAKVAGFIGKAFDLVGKFAPFLAAIPGLGTAVALASKIVSGINAVKGFVQSIKTGNWLGAIGSAASFVGGFAKGLVGRIANKLSQVTGFAQQALNTFKYGLGKGLLQVVSNGASLLSGAAGLLGNKGMAKTAGDVASYAGAVDAASHGNLLPAASLVANQFGPGLIQELRKPKKQQGNLSFFHGVRFNTKPTAKDFGNLDFGWLDNGFSVRGGDGGGGGGGGVPRGRPGLATKGLTSPPPASQKAYDKNMSKWMGDLRGLHHSSMYLPHPIARAFINTNMWALGNPLEWKAWIQESAKGTPPRLGTRTMDIKTRVPGANGDASLETKLAMWLANSPGNVTPAQLLRMSLEVNNMDYTMALLTCHNLLKNMTASERGAQGSKNQLTWLGQKMTLAQRDSSLSSKLVNMRPPGDNRSDLDVWYHTYAIGLISNMGGKIIATYAAAAESQQSHADGDWDDVEDRLNREAASAFGIPTTLLPRGLTWLMDWSSGNKR